MTDEELRREMEFIVTQQAQFAEQMQQSNRRLDRLEGVVKLAVRAGLRTRRNVREQLSALTEAQLRNAEAQLRNEERFAALAEAGAHTDRRLDALIDIVRAQQGGQS